MGRTVCWDPGEIVGHALAGHAVHGWWGQRTYSDTQDDQEIPPQGFAWAGRVGPLRLVSLWPLSQLLAWQDAEPMFGWVGGYWALLIQGTQCGLLGGLEEAVEPVIWLLGRCF